MAEGELGVVLKTTPLRESDLLVVLELTRPVAVLLLCEHEHHRALEVPVAVLDQRDARQQRGPFEAIQVVVEPMLLPLDRAGVSRRVLYPYCSTNRCSSGTSGGRCPSHVIGSSRRGNSG